MMRTRNDAAAEVRPRVSAAVVAGLWLVSWSVLTVAVCVELATAWPYVLLPVQLLLLLSVPGVLYRAAELSLMWRSGRPLTRGARWLGRFGALLSGIAIGMGLGEAMDERSMARFEQVMAPLIARLEASPDSTCPPAAAAAPDPELAAYIDASGGIGKRAELHRAGSRFVLSFRGRSIDIDGSTIFYDSVTRRWRKVHNDELARTQESEKLTQGLSACRIGFGA